MVYNDPTWDYRTFDFDGDLAYTDANFRPPRCDRSRPECFQEARGGKILYSSLEQHDPHGNPQHRVLRRMSCPSSMGERAATLSRRRRNSIGCSWRREGGSKGPDTFDSLPLPRAMGRARHPRKSILASHKTNDVVDRTRPLCPYPEVAVYKGSGSTDEAANFVCRNPRDRHHDNGR